MFSKLLFLLNTICSAILLVLYALQHFYVKGLVVATLLTPIFIVINICFLVYWLVKLNRNVVLPFLVLLLGYNQVVNSYRFFGVTEQLNEPTSFKVMSYNVMMFDRYGFIVKDDGKQLIELIKKENPDIIAMQEFRYQKYPEFKQYSHKYIIDKGSSVSNNQVFFSKFPIINQGKLGFEHHNNNAVFIDVAIHSDTLRLYNIHLESFRIIPSKQELNPENSDRLFKRMTTTLDKQKHQIEIVKKHQKQSPYKTIIMGDFNTTQYSYIYRQLSKNMKDTFNEKGKGFGRTHRFRFFPLRIDHILVDESINVLSHKNYSELYSDHFPIMAQLSLQSH